MEIPQSAQQIHTPLIFGTWQQVLLQYPNQQLVEFFLKGISEGFHIGYSYHIGSNLKAAKKESRGARQYPQVVDEYLSKELHLNRIAGPYHKSMLPSNSDQQI